jgi:hypothetical protein
LNVQLTSIINKLPKEEKIEDKTSTEQQTPPINPFKTTMITKFGEKLKAKFLLMA